MGSCRDLVCPHHHHKLHRLLQLSHHLHLQLAWLSPKSKRAVSTAAFGVREGLRVCAEHESSISYNFATLGLCFAVGATPHFVPCHICMRISRYAYYWTKKHVRIASVTWRMPSWTVDRYLASVQYSGTLFRGYFPLYKITSRAELSDALSVL